MALSGSKQERRIGGAAQAFSGQWRAMAHGNDGIHGNRGNVVPTLSAKHTSGVTAPAAHQ